MALQLLKMSKLSMQQMKVQLLTLELYLNKIHKMSVAGFLTFTLPAAWRYCKPTNRSHKINAVATFITVVLLVSLECLYIHP